MTNFFGVNITGKRNNSAFDGEAFITKRVSAQQSETIHAMSDRADELEEKQDLPKPLLIVRGVCWFVWIITGISIISSKSLIQAYRNAPLLCWAAGICFVVWLTLFVMTRKHRAENAENPEYRQFEEDYQQLLQQVRETLGVSADARNMDVLTERYTLKNGKVKSVGFGGGMTYHMNVEMFAFRRDDRLCLADLNALYEIPLASLRSMERMKKSLRLPDWNKKEPMDSPAYEGCELSTNNYGMVISPACRVEIIDPRGEFYLLIPEYDRSIFTALTGLEPERK